MITFACPSCAREVKAKDDLAGRKGKCTHCGSVITIPGAPNFEPPPLPRPAITVPPPRHVQDPAAPAVQLPNSAPSQVFINAAPIAEPRLKSAGWFARSFSTTMGIIAALVATVGVVMIATCGGCLYIGSQASSALSTPPKVASPSTAAGDRGSAAPPRENWPPHDATLRLGDIDVRINRVEIGKVPLEPSFSGSSRKSSSTQLIVWLDVTNASENKKIDHSSWSNDSSFRSGPSLTDNFDNTYDQTTASFTNAIHGIEKYPSLYPGKTAPDAVVFEVPVDNIRYLRLKLPGSNVKQDGEFRFQIPASAILGLGPGKEEAAP